MEEQWCNVETLAISVGSIPTRAHLLDFNVPADHRTLNEGVINPRHGMMEWLNIVPSWGQQIPRGLLLGSSPSTSAKLICFAPPPPEALV